MVPSAAALSPAPVTLRTSRALQLRAAMITSTFENSDTTLDYGYAENIHDGRGITAGRAGFTSATGDMLLVVRRYAKVRPKAPLVRFIPALKKVQDTGSKKGLKGLERAWRSAAKDPRFRRIQDDAVEKEYLSPALDLADRYRIRTPLGQAIVWDTAIQHGVSGSDGLKRILDETVRLRGYPQDEASWLETFLERRLWHLMHWSEGGFRQPRSSSSRVAAWRGLLGDRALQLEVPLSWTVYGDKCVIDARGRGGGPCR